MNYGQGKHKIDLQIYNLFVVKAMKLMVWKSIAIIQCLLLLLVPCQRNNQSRVELLISRPIKGVKILKISLKCEGNDEKENSICCIHKGAAYNKTVNHRKLINKEKTFILGKDLHIWFKFAFRQQCLYLRSVQGFRYLTKIESTTR